MGELENIPDRWPNELGRVTRVKVISTRFYCLLIFPFGEVFTWPDSRYTAINFNGFDWFARSSTNVCLGVFVCTRGK